MTPTPATSPTARTQPRATIQTTAEPPQQKRTLAVGVALDRFGPRVVATSEAILLLACIVAMVAPVHSVPVLAAALALLGLGWSLGLVSGTAMLGAALPLATRARTQGTVDLWIAVAGAIGGMASGLVVASVGYPTLVLVGGPIAAAVVLAGLLG